VGLAGAAATSRAEALKAQQAYNKLNAEQQNFAKTFGLDFAKFQAGQGISLPDVLTAYSKAAETGQGEKLLGVIEILDPALFQRIKDSQPKSK